MPYRIFEPMLDAYENGKKAYQGKVPEKAKIFFFGIDANYDNNMSKSFLDILRQYHRNGVAYWCDNWRNNANNDHHPFLLQEYGQRAGYVYHLMFKMMNLPADCCAEAISFVELLNVPTAETRKDDPNNLFTELLRRSIRERHIERLQNAILSGRDKLVFMPDEVIRNLKKINKEHGLFAGLKYSYVPADGLPVIYDNPARNITIHKNLHFSASCCSRVLAQLPDIKKLILDFLAKLKVNENRNCQQSNRADSE